MALSLPLRFQPLASLLLGLMLAISSGLLFLGFARLVTQLANWLPDTPSVYVGISISILPVVVSFALAWRCLSVFKKSDGAYASGLIFLALCCLVLLELAVVVGLFNAASDFKELLAAIRDNRQADVHSDAAGQVSIEGPIGDGLLNLVMQFDTAAIPLRVINISSEGGFIVDALDLAHFIERRGIVVIVGEECMSACTLVVTASPRLYAHKYSTFGFHKPYEFHQSHSELSRMGMKQQSDENRAFLLSHGVKQYLLDKADKFGPSELLQFSSQAMMEQGLVKGLLEDDTWELPDDHR